jgi:hypothetical protein
MANPMRIKRYVVVKGILMQGFLFEDELYTLSESRTAY